MNLRFGLAEDGQNGWVHRKKGYPSFVSQYPADFYSFQEANDFQVSYIEGLLQDYSHIGMRTPAPPTWQSNVIFFSSRWECVASQHFYLSPTPSVPSRFEGSEWPRQCTLGIFQSEGRFLVCINTHFDFSTDVQEKSARVILEALETLQISAPVVLMGDFNADPFSPCYRIFTQTDLLGMPSVEPFQDAFEQPFPGSFHGFTGRSTGDHIDWILYQGNLELTHRYVIEDKFSGQFLSDHFPLQAYFKFI